MKLKLDDQGHAVLQDGMPVYVNDDGKESPFDAAGTVATIRRLNGEAKGHRERAEAAEAKLKAFDGIDDVDAVRKALATVKNLDDKKLVDAGEVEKVKAEAIKSVRAEFDPVVKERDTLRDQLHAEKIGGSFSRSKFIAEKVAVPVDMIQATFGRHFSIEDGKVIAKDATGNQIFSPTRHGEPASFDEALQILIESYPHKDSILKADNQPGAGVKPNGGNGGGGKTMKRAAFDALEPAARVEAIKGGTTIVD